MKAIILAGGKGRRLMPYTTIFPKPLVPIGQIPILEIILRQLSHFGFKDAVLNVGYLAELIEAYFQNGSKRLRGLIINYSKETKPLGTAGSIASVKGLNKKPFFLVMNGDVLTDLDYKKLIEYHKKMKPILTIATYQREVKIDLGVIDANRNGNLCNYKEKPRHRYLVSMGIYVYSPDILKYIKKNEYLDFPDLVHRLQNFGKKISCYIHNGYWLDIGNRDDYEKASIIFKQNKKLFNIE
jgi:NDP-sugar pyrophosphorylase family protein